MPLAKDFSLVYRQSSDLPHWGKCDIDQKSYTGYAFVMCGAAIVGINGRPVLYWSKVYGAVGGNEEDYMKGLFGKLRIDLKEIILKNDNMGAQKNPTYHATQNI